MQHQQVHTHRDRQTHRPTVALTYAHATHVHSHGGIAALHYSLTHTATNKLMPFALVGWTSSALLNA